MRAEYGVVEFAHNHYNLEQWQGSRLKVMCIPADSPTFVPVMETRTLPPSGHWKLTLIWLLLIAIILGAFSAPILINEIDFPFWWAHCLFIVVFLLAIRYLFFLRHSWLASQQIVKTAMFFFCIWGVFYLVDTMHDFQLYADEDGLETFLGHLPNAENSSLGQFIKSEMIFFGTGSVIAVSFLAIRLVISVWRWHNRGKA